jgi:hypothetical protein
MLDTRSRVSVSIASLSGTPTRAVRGPRTRVELQLREMAGDLAGCLDRDELSRDDEELITDALEAAVAAALPAVLDALDRELTPRLEALPLKARLTLASARRRRDFGLD